MGWGLIGLGVVLLVLGFLFHVGILWTLGIVALVVGVVLFIVTAFRGGARSRL